MSPFDAIEKLITEHGSAAILRERIAQAKEQQAELEKENALLKIENGRLKAELEKARNEFQRLQPAGFVESMGVLWKRTATGFESYPYCKHCAGNPIMSPRRSFGKWICGSGKHFAPISVKPPTV